MINLDHIDPGNSGGSVKIPDTHIEFKPKKISYPCPLCVDVFDTEEDRRQHRFSKHPIKRPYLYIRGAVPRHEEIDIFTTLSKDDINIDDADTIVVDETKFTNKNEALNAINELQTGVRVIELIHQTYTVKYQLNFRIADDNTLNTIEEFFYDIFSNDMPMDKQLELFDSKTRTLDSTGMPYAGALGCYITAIMAKDRLPGSTISFESYISKLGEAQDKLEGYFRPLAKYINSIIGFMLNDFSDYDDHSSPPVIKSAKEFFRNGLFPSSTSEANNAVGTVIPVDISTEILSIYCSMALERRVLELSRISGLYSATSTDENDKIKLLFILWAMAKDNNNAESEIKYRKKLQHVKTFSDLIN